MRKTTTVLLLGATALGIAGGQQAQARTDAFEDGSVLWEGIRPTKSEAVKAGRRLFAERRWFVDKDVVIRRLPDGRWYVRATACLRTTLCDDR